MCSSENGEYESLKYNFKIYKLLEPMHQNGKKEFYHNTI